MHAGMAAGTVATALLGAGPAHAGPERADYCPPAGATADLCTVRLASVRADTVDGTITGTPVTGGTAVTLYGTADAYLPSTGFGAHPPQAIRDWDAELARVRGLDVTPPDPAWYGNAKAHVFLPRVLNGIAVDFPPGTLLVSFTPDETRPDAFQMVSVQPTPP